MHELRATGESLLRAASAAKCEATREFYVKRAKLLESLTKDVAWLDADRLPEWRAKEEAKAQAADSRPVVPPN
jgi:hypothetical protein